MSKYYFQKDDEICYTLDYHRDYMNYNNLESLELFEGKRQKTDGFFYCTEFSEVGEVGESCGKQCEKYQPRNGKNGICKHYGFLYEQTEKKITFRKQLTVGLWATDRPDLIEDPKKLLFEITGS